MREIVTVDRDVLVVRGGACLAGTAGLPGDKSISHRALLIGALGDGPVAIQGLSTANDVRATLDCLRRLGVSIETSSGTTVVHGRGPRGLGGPAVRLDCGDSGTTMRLLAGLLAGQDRTFELDGSVCLRRRPMERVAKPLRRMGARIETTDGFAPLLGQSSPLRGCQHALEVASAQLGSAALLAGLNATGETAVVYPAPVRDHTERILAAFEAPIEWTATKSALTGPVAWLTAPAGGIPIPADPSAAAFVVAAAVALPGSEVSLPHVGTNPARLGFFDAIEAMGASVTRVAEAPALLEPRATLVARHAPLHGVTIERDQVPGLIDELPLLAVLGCVASGLTRVEGAAELRVKESDRIGAIVEGLTRMGARIREAPDGFEVLGPTALDGTVSAATDSAANLDGRDDHRIIMALAVAGLLARGETRIAGAGRVADSFPGFVDTIRGLARTWQLA